MGKLDILLSNASAKVFISVSKGFLQLQQRFSSASARFSSAQQKFSLERDGHRLAFDQNPKTSRRKRSYNFVHPTMHSKKSI